MTQWSRWNIAVMTKIDCSGCDMFEHLSEINIRSDGWVWHRSVFNNGLREPKYDKVVRLFMPLDMDQSAKVELVHGAVNKAVAKGYNIERLQEQFVFNRRHKSEKDTDPSGGNGLPSTPTQAGDTPVRAHHGRIDPG